MTERDRPEPDDAPERTTTVRLSGSSSGDAGSTRVIGIPGRPGARPDPAAAGVHIPAQAGPPRAGAQPADPTRSYRPGEVYGVPPQCSGGPAPGRPPGHEGGRHHGADVAAHGPFPGRGPGQAPGSGGAHGGGQAYGVAQPPTPAPPYGVPPFGAPEYGAPGYGAAQAYGAAPTYGAPSYGPAPSYGAATSSSPPQSYGAAPTYGAAQPYGAAPGHGAGLPPAGSGYPPSAPGSPPPPGFTPPGATGGGRRKKTIIALVAVVVLLAGGLGAAFLLRGGGADSPAEATKLLADDLQSGDLAGAVSRLHPDEVALAGDVGGMLHDELVRLQIVRADADEKALVSGATFANLRFDDGAIDQVRPNVAIAKLVGGTVTLNRDVNALPLTDSYKKLAYPGGVPPAEAPEVIDIAKVVADQGRPVRVATVQVDGDWYVSLTYSLADAALVDEGRTWPQDTVAPRGSASAQDAVRDAMTALFAQDARRLVEMAPPHELAVVHDVGSALVQGAGTSRSTVRLVDLATTTSAVDGGTAVTIDRLVVEEGRGTQVTVVRDGDCLSATTTGGGTPERVCAQDLANQGVGAFPGSADPAVRDVLARVARTALGLKIVVVEDAGQYYVSPVRTVAGLGVDVLHTLQPADLARLADAAR